MTKVGSELTNGDPTAMGAGSTNWTQWVIRKNKEGMMLGEGVEQGERSWGKVECE